MTHNKGSRMISQKQAVTNAVLSVIPSYELSGEAILKDSLNTDNKKAIRTILFEAFQAGEVVYSKDASNLQDDKYVTKYVSGLLDNWVRKNPEFNNSFKHTINGKYETKNPGSRAGSGDEQVREMRKLLKTISDETTKAQVQEAIDARLAEIKPASVVTINAEALPEHLKHLVK